ncbi:MAG: DUF488 domain-containing protein [Desulfovibrionaceae bacterium]|nr:DUF488 domain-containing protein [Desulfovibrionaceae bacterium]
MKEGCLLMKVFSTYYDKVPELDKNVYTFVRVSRAEPPEWLSKTISQYVDLSDIFGPTKAMLEECHPTKDWGTFEPRYKDEILGALDKVDTLGLLNKISSEHDNLPLLLLCYEAPPENCHRHLIAGFLGINIEEL